MRLLEALLSALMVAGLYATMSYGLALIYGVMRIINLANAGTMMFGAFFTYVLWQTFGLDPLVLVFVVAPVFFLLGVAIEVLLVRRVSASAPIVSLLLLFGTWLVMQALASSAFGGDVRGVRQLKSFTIIVLGGLESITGVAIASFLLAVAENLTVTLSRPQLENLVSFVVLVVVLVVMPGGLAALLRRRRLA